MPTLDGLRGVAILLVVLLHFQLDDPDTPLGHAYVALVETGWVGVDLFFVLSGFLITGILYDSRSDEGYLRNFYARRALRIFPLYFGFLFALFFVAPRLFQPEWVNLNATPQQQFWAWLYLINVQIALQGDVAAFVGHFWSLAVEEQFYLVWPAVVLLCSRKHLIALCWSMVAAAFVTRAVLGFGLDNTAASYFLTPARMDALAVGALIALAVRSSGGLAPLMRWRVPVLTVSGAVLLALYAWRGLGRYDPLVSTVGFTVVAFFFGALLVTAIAAEPGTGVYRILAHPVLRFFGRYSYAMYVFHMVVHRVLKRTLFLNARPPEFLGVVIPVQLLFLVTATALTILISVASWHLFEKHFLKLKGRFEYGRPRQPEVVPAGLGAQTA